MNYRMQRLGGILGISLLMVFFLAGCNKNISESVSSKAVATVEEVLNTEKMFTERDMKFEYDESEATVVSLEETYTITEEGTYIFSGQLTDGQIIVDADDKKVQIVLDGVEITNENSACIYIKKANKVFVTLADETQNILTTSGVFEADGEINVDGTIFSKSDLTMNGTGLLQIVSKEGNGVVCKDELVITSGTYDVNAASHAIEAKDEVSIANGMFTLNAGKDGIHCENDEDSSLGYIYVENGDFTISAGEDGIDAISSLQIEDGTINITKSYEGLEASSIVINGGEMNICAEDDGINAAGEENNSIVINGGNMKVNAKGDGIDSNGTLEIAGGYIVVSGPEDNGNTAVDFDTNCTVTGGVLIATGSSGMVENISDSSTQVTMTIGFSEYTTEAFTVIDSQGETILTMEPEKKYNCIIISSPDLKVGETYTVTAGEETQEIEITDTVYSNVTGMHGPGGMGRPDGMGGPGGMGRPDGMQGPGQRGNHEDMPEFDGKPMDRPQSETEKQSE